MHKIALSIAAATFGLAATINSSFAEHHAKDEGTEQAPKASVYIIAPVDGAQIEGPVTVVFGLKGMGVAPAGVEHKNTGHHHLLINRDIPNKEERQGPLPASDFLKHYGGGQTEATLNLVPGEHTLQLVFADHNHVPFDPLIKSEQITITVLEPSKDDMPDEEDKDNINDKPDEEEKDDDKDSGLIERLF